MTQKNAVLTLRRKPEISYTRHLSQIFTNDCAITPTPWLVQRPLCRKLFENWRTALARTSLLAAIIDTRSASLYDDGKLRLIYSQYWRSQRAALHCEAPASAPWTIQSVSKNLWQNSEVIQPPSPKMKQGKCSYKHKTGNLWLFSLVVRL